MATLLVLTNHRIIHGFNVLWNNAGLDNGEGQIMGDISELRGLIAVLSFVACLVFIIGLIPPQFLIASYGGRTVKPPSYFDSIDLLYFIDTWNHTMDGTGCQKQGYVWRITFVFGGHNLKFSYVEANVTGEVWDLKMEHYWFWWIFETAHHNMEWLNKEGETRGLTIRKTELDSDYTEGNIRYTVKCDDFQMDAFFGFNETLYSSPSEAWDYGGLAIMLGIEFDQVNTSINAWSLISMLLFFQLPDMHWIINALIAVPIWVAMGYITVIMVYRTIGALFGGGA